MVVTKQNKRKAPYFPSCFSWAAGVYEAMKFSFKKMDKKTKDFMVAAIICIIVFVILTNLEDVLSGVGSFLKIFSSLLIGAILAYILNPMAAWFQKKLLSGIPNDNLRWILSVVLTLLVVFAFLVFILSMLIPQMIISISSLVDNIDEYTYHLSEKVDGLSGVYKVLAQHIMEYFVGDDGSPSGLVSLVADNLKTIISRTTSFGTKAVNWVIGAVMAVYFLLAKKNILSTFSEFFSLSMSPRRYNKSRIVTEKFNSIFTTYIVCELLDAVIIGVANMLFMLVTGMPYITFISVVVAVTNLAPTFGPIIGAVIGGGILFLTNPKYVIPFLVFTAVLQFADGYLIKPKLFGGALNVPSVLILVSIIVFGKLFGVPGMLLAIPLAAIIVFLYEEGLIPWLKLKREVKLYTAESQSGNRSAGTEDNPDGD